MNDNPGAAAAVASTEAEATWYTLAPAEVAAQLGVDMPITRAVVALLDGQLTPADAVVTLMGRGPASELM